MKAVFFFGGNIELKDLRFYTVSPEYLKHLSNVEPKVHYSIGDAYFHCKPYIGVVLEISGHRFLAPLTSYKSKQDKISNISAFKLHERGDPSKKLGMISLNNMIPVIDSEIQLLDIENQDRKYKQLLYKQYEFIKSKSEPIRENAKKLHYYVTSLRTPFYVNLCCDFTKMIDASRSYNK